MFRQSHVAILLVGICVGLLLTAPARGGRLFARPDQKADSVQKAYGVGAVQKFLPLGQVQKGYDFAPMQKAYAPVAPIQKEYDFAPTQKMYSPIAPVQKFGPAQKGGGAACCCPAYSGIRYHNHPLLRKRCCRCHPPIQTVLMVQDPRYCCCGTSVPVCISACCTGAPQVSSRVGLLGCGYVTYRWCCGFTIKVVFRARGDIVVHTYGL